MYKEHHAPQSGLKHGTPHTLPDITQTLYFTANICGVMFRYSEYKTAACLLLCEIMNKGNVYCDVMLIATAQIADMFSQLIASNINTAQVN